MQASAEHYRYLTKKHFRLQLSNDSLQQHPSIVPRRIRGIGGSQDGRIKQHLPTGHHATFGSSDGGDITQLMKQPRRQLTKEDRL